MAIQLHQSKLFIIFNIILAFIKFYTFLIIFSPIILLFIVFRLCISFMFLIFFSGRYKLMGAKEGMLGMDSYANVLTITYFVYVKGQLNLPELQNRFAKVFLNFRDKKTGQKPYEKLLCAIVPKWGFMCYENTRNTFDISKHVCICPGYEPTSGKHTEPQVLEQVAKLTDELWCQERPRWEVLIFPQIQLDNNCEELSNIVALRFHHAYVDGISFVQICRNVFFDQPCPKLYLDPVSPNLPKVPWYLKVWWWIAVIFIGPYSSTKRLSNTEEHVFYEGSLTGNKFIGRSPNPVSIPTMKRIRDTFGVCTSAVQHSAFLGAMHRMAEKKGFPVPKSVIAGAVFANLPYPNEYPTNNVQFATELVPMGIPNALKRLSATHEFYSRFAAAMPDRIASGLLIRIVGLFPATLAKKTFGKIRYSYVISNVPGISLPAKLQGNEAQLFFGVPPCVNGLRYMMGVGVYENYFQFGFIFEQSNLIKAREDVDEFIRYFDNEIKYLDTITQLGYK